MPCHRHRGSYHCHRGSVPSIRWSAASPMSSGSNAHDWRVSGSTFHSWILRRRRRTGSIDLGPPRIGSIRFGWIVRTVRCSRVPTGPNS